MPPASLFMTASICAPQNNFNPLHTVHPLSFDSREDCGVQWILEMRNIQTFNDIMASASDTTPSSTTMASDDTPAPASYATPSHGYPTQYSYCPPATANPGSENIHPNHPSTAFNSHRQLFHSRVLQPRPLHNPISDNPTNKHLRRTQSESVSFKKRI